MPAARVVACAGVELLARPAFEDAGGRSCGVRPGQPRRGFGLRFFAGLAGFSGGGEGVVVRGGARAPELVAKLLIKRLPVLISCARRSALFSGKSHNSGAIEV